MPAASASSDWARSRPREACWCCWSCARRAVRWAGSSVSRAGGTVVATALVGGGLMLAVSIAALPFAAFAHERAVDFGKSTQSWVEWGSDRLTSSAIAIVLAAAGAALFAALMRRFPRGWWLAGDRRRRVHRGPVRVAGARRARPGVQQLPGPTGRSHACRRRAAGAPGRRRRGGGAGRRRIPAHDGRQRVRGRARAHEARGALRHPADPLHAGSGATRGRARAGTREASRPGARDAVGGDRRSRRDARRDAAHPPVERARRDPTRHGGLAAGVRARTVARRRSRRRSSRISCHGRSRPTRTPTRSS